MPGSYTAGPRINHDRRRGALPFTQTELKAGRLNILAFLKRNLRELQDEDELNAALDSAGIIKASRNNGGNFGGKSVRIPLNFSSSLE